MKILVTGSNGQLGSELKIISKSYPKLIFHFSDIEEFDITNPTNIDRFFSELKPDFLINCAAYTAVDKAQEESKEAYKLNTMAPGLLALKCLVNDCKMIHISTDYVFDGESQEPYKEDSKTNPQSVYGKSKLEGEIATISSGSAMIIRTSWLYSSFGNNFVKTILRNGKIKPELRVVNDQIGNPTWANDLAKAILHIITSKGKHAFKPEIFNYSNNGTCSWYEFASEIIELTHLNCKVIPIPTSEYPTAAKRPKYSVLSKDKIVKTFNVEVPDWKTSLTNCIKLININEL